MSFNPSVFEAQVDQVAEENAASEEARRVKREAEAGLLAAVISKALPVIRVIGTRPQTAEQIRHHADCNYDNGVITKEHAEFRAVHLAGDTEAVWDTPRANSGASKGLGLWLTSTGELVEIAYSGTWSKWQGSSWGWESELRFYPDKLAALNDGWTDVGAYVAKLAEAVNAAVGKRAKSIEADKTRAEQVAAISALLGKGRR